MTYTNLPTLAEAVAQFAKVNAPKLQNKIVDGLINDPQTVTSFGPDGKPVFGYRTEIKLNSVYVLVVTEFFGSYFAEIKNTWA